MGQFDQRIKELSTQLAQDNPRIKQNAASALLHLSNGNQQNKSEADAICQLGALNELLLCMEENTSPSLANSCSITVWAVCNKVTDGDLVRESDCISKLVKVLQLHNQADPPPKWSDPYSTISAILNALNGLSFHEKLHASLKASRFLSPVAYALSKTTCILTKMAGVFLVAAVYSGDDSTEEMSTEARELISRYQVEEYAAGLLGAVLHNGGEYQTANWEVTEALRYVFNLSANTEKSLRLAEYGGIELILESLQTKTVHLSLEGWTDMSLNPSNVLLACRALLNWSYIPQLKSKLGDGVEILQPLKTAEDERLRDTVKGFLLQMNALDDVEAMKANAESAILATSHVGSADDSEHSTVPKYDVFISYKQTDAKDFARGLHTALMLNGFTTFLDMDYNDELNDLEMIVQNSTNLIFILTDNILKSEWCKKELGSAVRNGVNIVLLVKEGSRWPNSDGQFVCTFPPYEIISTLPEAVKPAFSKKAIDHSDTYYSAYMGELLKRLKKPGVKTQQGSGVHTETKTPAIETCSNEEANESHKLREILEEFRGSSSASSAHLKDVVTELKELKCALSGMGMTSKAEHSGTVHQSEQLLGSIAGDLRKSIEHMQSAGSTTSSDTLTGPLTELVTELKGLKAASSQPSGDQGATTSEMKTVYEALVAEVKELQQSQKMMVEELKKMREQQQRPIQSKTCCIV